MPTVSPAPIILWLLVQLGALLFAALRVPFAAEYPQPAEFRAVQVLIVAQFVWATMLFPSLLQSWAMTLIACCAAWVMLVTAAILSAWSITDVFPIATFLTFWICILAVMRAALTPRWQLIASALASTYVIGGPLLWYLQSDFGTSQPVERGISFGPLWIGVALTRNLPRNAWWSQVGIGLVAVCVFAISIYRNSLRHRRQADVSAT